MMTSLKKNIFTATALSALVMATTSANAKEFYIWGGSHITGFSSNEECEASGFGSGGCERFGSGGTCGGYSIYVGDFSGDQMMDEFNKGEKITIRHLKPGGYFGDVICAFAQ